MSLLLDLGIVLAVAVTALLLYYKKQYRFWRDLNVPYQPPHVPFGNIKDAISRKTIAVVLQELYERWPGERFIGTWMFYRPALLIRDPELVKQVLVSDFKSFHDRGIYVNEKDDPLLGNLFAMRGPRWRGARTKLTPTFTAGKVKMMFAGMQEVARELEHVLSGPGERGEVVEMKEIAARFTTDVISLCAFGIKANSLNNPNSEFRTKGKLFFEPNLIQIVKMTLQMFLPNVAKFLNFRTTNKAFADFFFDAMKSTVTYRRETGCVRNDFMQLLMQLMDKGKLDDGEETTRDENRKQMTFEEATAQAFAFFAAGFESSSTTIQFALYELALHQDIQTRARQEVRAVLNRHGGSVTYEALQEMTYLSNVINETLRKYPPLAVLQRECNRDVRLNDCHLTVPKGTLVQISVSGLHYDPAIYRNPLRFDPDRFTDGEAAQRHHYTYLPFGEGPRICIGMRFGLVQTKLGLATLLATYLFDVCKETKVPPEMAKRAFFLTAEGGVHLRISKVQE